MIYEIPLTPTPASYTQETQLDGRTYQFTVRWNAREGYWYLTLADQDDVVIAGSRKLVAGALLLRHISGTDKPPGELYMSADATETGLGTSELLLYADADELGR